MFERFTDRARRVVVLAQEEARLLNHNYIGTEHILLGLIHEGEGVAAKALESLGISLDGVRAQVEAIIGQGGIAPSGHVPFTPRAKKVLELSLREALQLGHNYIGTEHILLGLIREGEGVAAIVLGKLGAVLPVVRETVMQLLAGYTPTPAAPPDQPTPDTPASARAATEARKLAGRQPVGTQHMLRAMVADPDSLAAKALAQLGISAAAVEAALAMQDTAGTADELPEDAGARTLSIEILDGRLAIVIDDTEGRDQLARAFGSAPFVLRSSDPAAASFPALWQDLTRHLADVHWRLEKAAGERWRPTEWARGWTVAAYVAYNHPSGLRSALELAQGEPRTPIKLAMAEWLSAQQPVDLGPITYLGVLVDRAEDDELAFRLFSGNRTDWPSTPSHFLVAHAVLALTDPTAAPG